tara:strand:- start:276 stop:485 length:210 start_codon:yes stop_codon:yes gene_type:complete
MIGGNPMAVMSAAGQNPMIGIVICLCICCIGVPIACSPPLFICLCCCACCGWGPFSEDFTVGSQNDKDK